MLYIWTSSGYESEDYVLVSADSIEEARKKATEWLLKHCRRWNGQEDNPYALRNLIRDEEPDFPISEQDLSTCPEANAIGDVIVLSGGILIPNQ
jgi:hypothetical protein